MARRVGVAPRSLVPEYRVLPEEMDRAAGPSRCLVEG